MSAVTVTLLSQGKTVNPAYGIAALDVNHEVNRIPTARLSLLDGDPARQKFPVSDQGDFNPGKELEIRVRTEGSNDGEETLFKGIITGQGVEANPDGALLTVEAKDPCIRLTNPRKNRVFAGLNDAQAIRKILKENNIQAGEIAETQDLMLDLVQFTVSDWDFILARADALGLIVTVKDGALSLQDPRVVFGNFSGAEISVNFGLDQIHSVDLQIDGKDQTYKSQREIMKLGSKEFIVVQGAETRLSPGSLSGERIAKKIGFEGDRTTQPGVMSLNEAKAWTNAMINKSRLAFLRGRVCIPGNTRVALLKELSLHGFSKLYDGVAPITGIRHRIDLKGWRTDLQIGLSPAWHTDSDDVGSRPASGLVPPIRGLQLAQVSSFEKDPEDETRMKINLLKSEGHKPVWARLAAPEAGEKRGWFIRPQPKDEVVVGFINDDPRQPVILGSLYSKDVQHKEKITAENQVRSLVTKAELVLRLDDQHKTIQLETPGPNRLTLSGNGKEIRLDDQHGNRIIMDKNGITVKSAKDLLLEAAGSVAIKGSKVDIQ